MFVEKVIKDIGTAASAYEASIKLAPVFKSVFKQLQGDKLRIAIFGAGGTGKTTLGNILAGRAILNNVLSPYQESLKVEIFKLDSNIPGLTLNTAGSVQVAPGQEERQNQWDEIFPKIISGQVCLIINVVSYGYHSFGTLSYQEDPRYQSGMTTNQFTSIYVENRRIRETEALQAIESAIKLAKGRKIMMLTLVTKQDLWWPSRAKVQDYYQNGEYNQVVNNIQLKRGTDWFQHEYVSASLSIENFVSGIEEFLWPNSEGYDERLKISNIYKLFNIISSLCDKSS
jgi:hypothetical protein